MPRAAAPKSVLTAMCSDELCEECRGSIAGVPCSHGCHIAEGNPRMTQKTPQDRKAKADGSHRFTAAGKSYTLPPISEEAGTAIPGGVTYDAIMKPDDAFAQLRLALATLEAAKPTKAAMDALRALPTDKMLEVIGEWMGGSSASSD